MAASLRQLTENWLNIDWNNVTRNEIKGFDEETAKERLSGTKRLEFGTAGLRGMVNRRLIRMLIIFVGLYLCCFISQRNISSGFYLDLVGKFHACRNVLF